MARTAITVQAMIAKYPALPVTADSADFTLAAGDAANGNTFTATGREIVIARNTGAGARTITIQSTADRQGREGDIGPYTIGAGQFAVIPVLALDGFRQTDGQVYVDVEHAEVTVAVLRLPD